MQTLTQTQTQTQTHTRTRLHAYTHARTHAHTQVHSTHTHTHTPRAHARTHAHTPDARAQAGHTGCCAISAGGGGERGAPCADSTWTVSSFPCRRRGMLLTCALLGHNVHYQGGGAQGVPPPGPPKGFKECPRA
eukprot:12870512-Alexandrium_andersonii.AAC.1